MSSSNRFLSRLLLTLLGIAWLAAGAWVVLRHAWPDALAPLEQLLGQLDGWTIAGWRVDWAIVAAVAGGALLVLAIIHSTTRGRGRTGVAAEARDLRIDRDAVQDLFRHELGDHPDVLATHVQPWRRGRRQPAWRIGVSVRSGARLDELADRVAEAARATRAGIGAEAPIVVHLAGGIRSAVASERRAA